MPALRQRHCRPFRGVQPSLRQPPHSDRDASGGLTHEHRPAWSISRPAAPPSKACWRFPRHAIGLVLFAHGSGSSRHSPRNNYVAGVLRRGRRRHAADGFADAGRGSRLRTPLRHCTADAAPAGCGTLGAGPGGDHASCRWAFSAPAPARPPRLRLPRCWVRRPGPWCRAAAARIWRAARHWRR